MKKQILLVSGAALLALSLSSYSDGPGNHASLNCTAGGGPGNCSGSGCHSANTTNTTAQLIVSNTIGGPAITQYTPGATYYVALSGTNTASLPGYGFQAEAVTAGNIQAGSFTIGSIADQHTTSFIGPGNVQLIENKRIIPYTSGPGVYEADFLWTAPVAGKGTVTFYSLLLAANGDGTEAGDQANAAPPVVISEAGASGVTDINNARVTITAYPNPVHNTLQLRFSNTANGIYTVTVYDAAGKNIWNRNFEINNQTLDAPILASNWPAGIYHVQIVSHGLQRTIPILKS
ncbi:MAG: choice-of-anchor V domain-containing protein [Flavipsychrobacter sp.]